MMAATLKQVVKEEVPAVVSSVTSAASSAGSSASLSASSSVTAAHVAATSGSSVLAARTTVKQGSRITTSEGYTVLENSLTRVTRNVESLGESEGSAGRSGGTSHSHMGGEGRSVGEKTLNEIRSSSPLPSIPTRSVDSPHIPTTLSEHLSIQADSLAHIRPSPTNITANVGTTEPAAPAGRLTLPANLSTVVRETIFESAESSSEVVQALRESASQGLQEGAEEQIDEVMKRLNAGT